MRKLVICTITLIMAVYLAGCSAPPTVKEFKSASGRFTVMSPAPLQEETRNIETDAGKIELHLFTGQADDIAYVIGYSDYAAESAPPDRAQQILDGARNGAVGNTHGQLVLETPISLSGYPGRELVIEAHAEDRPPATIKGRLFLVKNRLYQVTVVAPRGKAGDKVIDDFLQSFKLLEQ
jgi:hypothetical protein